MRNGRDTDRGYGSTHNGRDRDRGYAARDGYERSDRDRHKGSSKRSIESDAQHRDRHRDAERKHHRHRSPDRERRTRRRSSESPDEARRRSPTRDARQAPQHHGKRARSPDTDRNGRTKAETTDEAEAKRAAYLAKLAAMSDSDSEDAKPAFKSLSVRAHAASAPAAAPVLFSRNDADEPTGLAPALVPQRADVREDFARKQQEAARRQAEHARAQAQDEDALDAFMEEAVMPEVAAKDAEAQRREEEERRKLLEDLQAGRKDPLAKLLVEDEEPDEVPVLEFEVPQHKVKLIIGAGGENIKAISRKSKTRIQVKKNEAEMERGFGEGQKIRLPGKIAVLAAAQRGEAAPQQATIQIFGDAEKAEFAKELVMEAVDNRDQKQKQRQKEYEKKRDEKARNRQIYHMRHTRDYEVLEVPIGTSKPELKEAYRRLAKKWHPDRHPDNREEAKERFQAISKAYESLMTTDEEVSVKSLGTK